jgi:hypothetical protein
MALVYAGHEDRVGTNRLHSHGKVLAAHNASDRSCQAPKLRRLPDLLHFSNGGGAHFCWPFHVSTFAFQKFSTSITGAIGHSLMSDKTVDYCACLLLCAECAPSLCKRVPIVHRHKRPL